MSTSEFLKKLPAAVNGEAVAGQQCTVQLNISSLTYISVADGACAVHEGTAEAPDVTLTLSDEHLIELLTGKLAGATAFMTGKLQIDGDLMLAKDVAGFFDAARLA